MRQRHHWSAQVWHALSRDYSVLPAYPWVYHIYQGHIGIKVKVTAVKKPKTREIHLWLKHTFVIFSHDLYNTKTTMNYYIQVYKLTSIMSSVLGYIGYNTANAYMCLSKLQTPYCLQTIIPCSPTMLQCTCIEVIVRSHHSFMHLYYLFCTVQFFAVTSQIVSEVVGLVVDV